MASFIDVCLFTPTLGGTTDWTVSSAVTGYQTPALAGAVNGVVYRYRAESNDLSQWEVGSGVYSTSGTVLARTTVLFNSSGTGTGAGQTGAGSKINFTAVPRVAIVALAEDLVRTQSVTPCGRLTLTSGVPVTTSDVGAATSLYWTPFNGDHISLWDGNSWIPIQFPETTLSVAGFAANTNYDIWARNNAGALALDSTAWTNDVTRATAITTLNGVDVKSGDPTRRLLGTVRTTATAGQVADTLARRYVSNRYNEAPRIMQAIDPATSWSYQSSTLRQANGNTDNQIDFVTCVARPAVAEIIFVMSNTVQNGTLVGAIGLDNTTADNSSTKMQAISPQNTGTFCGKANYLGNVPAGRHFLAWLEAAFPNGGTMTQYGVVLASLRSGITGVISG